MAEANLKITIKNRQKPFDCCKENYKTSSRIIAAGNNREMQLQQYFPA